MAIFTGALAALGVSIFPTGAIAPVGAPGWWKEWMRPVHHGSAALLFGCFVYSGCGIGMAICIAWLTKGRAEWTLRQVARTIGSMGRRRAQ